MQQISSASIHLQAADAAIGSALAYFDGMEDALTVAQVLEDAQRRVQKALADVDDIEGAADDLIAKDKEVWA